LEAAVTCMLAQAYFSNFLMAVAVLGNEKCVNTHGCHPVWTPSSASCRQPQKNKHL